MTTERQIQETLVYREVPYNGGLVFALKQQAEYVARIHRALKASRTWGAFRAKMPRAEYSRVVRSSFDEMGERRPKSGHAFSAEQVAGWSDGDYPRWLQQAMENVLPTALLERYGRRCSSVINGSFWMIPPENGSEMIRHLRALGYRVQSRRRLNFH